MESGRLYLRFPVELTTKFLSNCFRTVRLCEINYLYSIFYIFYLIRVTTQNIKESGVRNYILRNQLESNNMR